MMDQYRIKTLTEKLSVKSMFNKQYRYRLRAVWLYTLCRQFSGAGFLMFYATQIFDHIGQNGAIANLVIASGLWLGATLSFYTIGLWGRRNNLIMAFALQAITFSFICIMVWKEWYPLLYPVCLCFMIPFSIGSGVAMVWRRETVPPQGMSIVMPCSWISVSLTGQFTPMLTENWPGPLG